MSRSTWVYPSDGSAPYEKGSREEPTTQTRFPTVMGDLPDFVSSVDGRAYSGRAGLREHCLRNNVVPYDDLKGLPPLKFDSDTRSVDQRRASDQHRKEFIINQVNKHYR